MKILIIITKGEVGGAQMSVLNLARNLKQRGNEVFVGFGEGNFLKNELKKEDIDFKQFKNLKRTHNIFSNIFFVNEVRRFLNKNKFDVVHINSSNALFASLGAKLASIKPKVIFTFRGMSMLDDNYKLGLVENTIYSYFFKFFLKFVDIPVFVSRENLEKARNSNLTQKGVLVYNGLSFEKQNFFDKEEAKKFFESKIDIDLSDKYIIGSIGRLAYQKNYEFLINNFQEILKIKNNAITLIIGGGDEYENLKKLISEKKLSDKIYLIGSIDNAGRYIKAFNLFALTSRYEGLSITLIEALFSNVPILASDVGGNRETLGISEELFDLNNSDDFLLKFKNLQNISYQKILQNNQKQSEKFDLNKTVDGYLKLYERQTD